MTPKEEAVTPEPTKKTETYILSDTMFKFRLEDGTAPELSSNSKLVMVINSQITEVEIKDLFYEKEAHLDMENCKVRGFSFLEFLNLTSSELIIDNKPYKIGLFDIQTSQFLKITELYHVDHWKAYFAKREKELTEKEVAELKKILNSAKKMTEKVMKEEKEVIATAVKEEVLSEIQNNDKDVDEYTKYSTVRDAFVYGGYKEYKHGTIRFLVQKTIPITEKMERGGMVNFLKTIPKYSELDYAKQSDGHLLSIVESLHEEPEYIVQLEDEKEEKFTEIDYEIIDQEEDGTPWVYLFSHDGSDFHLTYNFKGINITDAKEFEQAEAEKQAILEAEAKRKKEKEEAEIQAKKDKEEAEAKAAKEKAEKEEEERELAEAKAKKEKEEAEERAEAEAKEKAEKEEREREEAEAKAKAEKEAQERKEAELEAKIKAKLEAEREAKLKAEKEAEEAQRKREEAIEAKVKAKLEAEAKAEKERLEKEEEARKAKEAETASATADESK